MNPQFIRQSIINNMRLYGHSFESARNQLLSDLGLPADHPVVAEVWEEMRQEAQRVIELVDPAVVRPDVVQDLRDRAWYTGPRDEDIFWPTLERRLETGSLADVVEEIDLASTKVVGHFADPGLLRMKKKGLVVGYVQSGKTANYTAVMAKAADAGYRLFIVLSGIHNNLRRQTQLRIEKDLGTRNWVLLTDGDHDFGKVRNAAALMNGRTHMIAVVKKNPTRLKNLRDWLREVDESALARTPILILDDEADQATPNTLAARAQVSKINSLVKEIWSTVPTGCYVGYTATPFANVFMDPDDDEDLYPSDFIFDLPRPDAYFGAERIFGRSSLGENEEPDVGLDMVRSVSEDEADLLRPPSNAEQRATYDPALPDSLVEAFRWFVLAVAVRRLRGQGREHTSMLVHTSAYVAPHFAMQSRFEELLAACAHDEDWTPFRATFDREGHRVTDLNGYEMPAWDDVRALIPDVVRNIRVIVDNGASTDRLDYGRKDSDGNPIVETVIAIGGGTLSRGLTLEGLVVSYFARTTNTYDALLQMGRWFGYRPGYEDLPRIWMPDDLAADFSFLALVEEEIRQEMRRLEDIRATPRQFGLKVRAHPGRLAITAATKMFHADRIRVSYAGQRHQTIVFEEKNRVTISANIDATRSFLKSLVSDGGRPVRSVAGRRQLLDVPAGEIAAFLQSFEFHPRQAGLRGDHVAGWITKVAPESRWNVVVLGRATGQKGADGAPLELGDIDLGLPERVRLINRSPLASETGLANIKALLSQSDWVADFSEEALATRRDGEKYDAFRRRTDRSTGLLIVVPIGEKSVPLRAGKDSRRAMAAPAPLIGLGIVFPDGPDIIEDEDGTFYSVKPDWDPVAEGEVEVFEDTEGSLEIDASMFKDGL